MDCVEGNNITNIFLRTLSEHTPIMQSHKKPSSLEFVRNNTFKFSRSIPRFSVFFKLLIKASIIDEEKILTKIWK